MAKSNVKIAKKGEVDDVIVDFRDAYYDLLIGITEVMDLVDDGKYQNKEDLLDVLEHCLQSSLHATPPKDLA